MGQRSKVKGNTMAEHYLRTTIVQSTVVNANTGVLANGNSLFEPELLLSNTCNKQAQLVRHCDHEVVHQSESLCHIISLVLMLSIKSVPIHTSNT